MSKLCKYLSVMQWWLIKSKCFKVITNVCYYEIICFRVEYDAYRLDVESLQISPRDASQTQKLNDAQQRYLVHKEKFENLRSDVAIKMKFLDENRVGCELMIL